MSPKALVPEESQYHGGLYQRLHRFYRGTTFQAIILGLVSFTQPGIWDALNSMSSQQHVFPSDTDFLNRSGSWRSSQTICRECW